jgi:hypothetical protein
MAKVTFYLDNGANIHSCRKKKIDTVKDLHMEEGEWEAMTDDEKYKIVDEWAQDKLQISWEDEAR